MSQPRDSDDFLGWAPDIGFWDAPVEPTTSAPPQPPDVAVPPPPAQAVTRRSAPGRTAPPAPTPPRGAGQRPATRTLVPVLVAFAVALVVTFFTALLMAIDGPGSSPAVLLVFGALTAILGRLAWVKARR